jgi:hypothetical protein
VDPSGPPGRRPRTAAPLWSAGRQLGHHLHGGGFGRVLVERPPRSVRSRCPRRPHVSPPARARGGQGSSGTASPRGAGQRSIDHS